MQQVGRGDTAALEKLIERHQTLVIIGIWDGRVNARLRSQHEVHILGAELEQGHFIVTVLGARQWVGRVVALAPG